MAEPQPAGHSAYFGGEPLGDCRLRDIHHHHIEPRDRAGLCNAIAHGAGTHGNEFTRLQILLYTLVLLAACLLPFAYGMSGWLYLAAALVLNAGFIGYAIALWRNYSDALARKTFRFSLIHLSALFAALLLDHYL